MICFGAKQKKPTHLHTFRVSQARSMTYMSCFQRNKQEKKNIDNCPMTSVLTGYSTVSESKINTFRFENKHSHIDFILRSPEDLKQQANSEKHTCLMIFNYYFVNTIRPLTNFICCEQTRFSNHISKSALMCIRFTQSTLLCIFLKFTVSPLLQFVLLFVFPECG